MYDSTAILKKEKSRTYDKYANEIITYEDREVFVYPRSVYASEFYNAAQAGLNPSITLELANRADYEGETLVQYDSKLYTVIRADWRAQRDNLSLVLEELNDGSNN